MKLRTSPLFVSVVSVVPGLGLWLLGKHRHSIIAASLVFGTCLVCLAAPWEWLMSANCNVAIILWVMQIFYAGYEAQLKRKVAMGIAQDAREEFSLPSVLPPDVKGAEKAVFKAKEIVRHQMGVGEQILDAVPATQMSLLRGVGSYRLYYIGLFRDKIVLIDTDFFGKPASLQQIPFPSIRKLEVKRGMMNDSLMLTLANSAKPVKLKVARRFRAHTYNFEKVFSEYKGEST